MAVLAVFFKFIHWFYTTQFDPSLGLAGPVVHRFDFVILTLATLTEPDPLPWFPKASAGILFCNLTNFYTGSQISYLATLSFQGVS